MSRWSTDPLLSQVANISFAASDTEVVATEPIGVRCAQSTGTGVSGKFYGEFVTYDDGGGGGTLGYVGVSNQLFDGPTTNVGGNTNSWAIESDSGNKRTNNSTGSNVISGGFAYGDTVQIAVDLTANKMWFGKNGTFQGDPAAGTGEAFSITGTTFRWGCLPTENFNGWRFIAQGSWSYTPPTGFNAPFTDSSVPVGALSLAGHAPGLLGRSFPELGTVSIDGKVPLALSPVEVSISAAAATLTGYAPTTVVGGRTITVLVGSLSITGAEPTNLVLERGELAGDAALPGLTASGTASFGNVFAGDAELPPLEADFITGYQGSGELPALTFAGTLNTGRIFSGDGTLPALTTAATATISIGYAGDASLASMQSSGQLLVGSFFSGDSTLPGLKSSGTLLGPLGFAGSVTLVALEASGELLTGSLLAGDAQLPMLTSDASFSDATVLTYYGLSTNTFNQAHGPYSNVDFDGLGRLGSNTYAAMSDGLYRMDGDDDDGDLIPADFLLGKADFGVEAVKAQRVAYLGATTDGPLELMVRTDTDGEDIYTYTVEDPHVGAVGDSPSRIKLGRGLRGRYWQIGMRNTDGASFRIDRIGLGVWNSTRKR